MSERLRKLINEAMIKDGVEAFSEKAKLCKNTLVKIASGQQIPHRSNAYKLALACDCSERDAMELALQCVPKRAKKAS